MFIEHLIVEGRNCQLGNFFCGAGTFSGKPGNLLKVQLGLTHFEINCFVLN